MKAKAMSLLQGIDTIIIRVKDFNDSKDWYQNSLGLTPVFEDASMKLVVFDTKGPTSLTIWQTEQIINNHKETCSYPIFRTPDAAGLRDEMKERNIQTGELVPGDHVHYFQFYDPDGNVLEACQVLE
ncbi:MAG TPA: VOC family protein [Flavisolibacter sp.]